MSRTPALLLLAALLGSTAPSAAPVGTSFTYQGELRFNGQPANASYDFEFALFDLASGGAPLATQGVADQPVAQGLFTVELDYTDVPFGASLAYWIEVRVREGASTGGYQQLLPRQKVTPSPYAINARSVRAAGVDSAAIADGAVTGGKIAIDAVTSSKIADGTIGAADLDTTQVQRRVAGGCGPGEAIRGVDAAGAVVCQGVGIGTVTTVATGDGLTGGPVVGSGTISIADGGVGSVKIADNSLTAADLASSSVASAEIADGSVVAADVNSASLQLRVTGSCNGGISSVGADGIAACNDAVTKVQPVNTSFSGQVHPSAMGASSVAIGTDGFPLIAAHHVGNGDLFVVHCEDSACSATTVTAIDTTGDVGAFNSIGIGRNGFGVVSYYDATNGDLKLAFCSNLACTSANLRTIDSADDVGKHTSIAFVGTNRPAIAYYDQTNGNLKFALCQDDVLCANVAFGTVDASTNDVGLNASLLVFRNVVTIAYHDATAGTLKIVQCSFFICTTGPIGGTTADATPISGAALSMIRAANGFPAVFYTRNASIYVLRCTSLSCSTFSPGTLVTNENASFLAASMDAIGYPVVAIVGFQAPNEILAVLRCHDPQCSSASRGLEIATTPPGFSAQPSIALGHHGFPVLTVRSLSRTSVYVCDNHACGFGSRAR